MIENGHTPHMPDEEVMREYMHTREHIELPADLPDDIVDAIETDPNPQTLQWVIDESHGDVQLLRLLLVREKLNHQFLDPSIDRTMLREDLEPVAKAIRTRKEELGLDDKYRF